MATLNRRRRGVDYWPGFVDALASLLMVMVFVIMIFALGQFVLGSEVSDRDRSISLLQAEIAELAHTLSLETDARGLAETRVAELSASLTRTIGERDITQATLEKTREALEKEREQAARVAADIDALQRLKSELESEVARLVEDLDRSEAKALEREQVSDHALAQVELLNRQLAALRTQLDELNNVLASTEKELAERDLRIEELGRELNLALAMRVQELNRYRSEFFGRLRAVLGEREDIQIVGDRFVFSSEVLFPSASDTVSEEGRQQLEKLAETLQLIAEEIPDDLPWVLQVDGHTDRRPIATARFPSNWELSTARALAIVKFLRAEGVSPQRLAATGYGEFHPLEEGDSAEALARNRRIELKLTSR